MSRILSHLVSRLFTNGPISYVMRKKAVLILLLIVGVSVPLISFSFAHEPENVVAGSSSIAQPSPTPQESCCGQNTDLDKPHFLAASYYNVGDNLTATLMLNNKGPEPVQVQPTLFSMTGERLEVAPLIVEGESFRNINLGDLGALPGTLFQEGSLQLFHRGPDLVIGAQLYIVDEEHSLSFDEKLVEFQGVAATQLESVWWLPSRRSSVNLILSNTSDLAVTAEAVLNAGTPDRERVDVTLSPHETRIIKVEREKHGKGQRSKDDVGSASINHSGPKGSLIARALVEDENIGYSLSAQFYSPQGGKSSGYQGVGLRLGKVAGQDLIPIVVARNVGDVPTYISGRMPYSTTEGRTGVVQLPKVRLAPGEASTIDIERAIKKAGHSQSIATASLEFDYTTPPGSVMMSAQSVSEDGNQVFRVPMWDVPAQRNGTGGYPWFIKDNSSTFVYIKNVTDKEQKYTFSLTYEGGDYSTGIKSIKAGQSVAFDLRAIRDNQIPDERGITIPLNAERGKIVWSVRGPDPLALLGRSEQADLFKGTSSSYACFMCCPNSFRRSRLDPFAISLSTGEFGNLRGVEQDQTCYGGQTPEYYIGDTWTSSNTSVATAEGFGDTADITAIGSGTATITGHWEVYNYTSAYSYEYSYHYCETASNMTEPERPVQVCTVPNGETTASGGWAGSAHMWNQTLTPSGTNFAGRIVTEQDPGGGGPDDCHFTGSAIAPFTAITGGTWTVGSGNTWGADTVGRGSNSVTYYRAQGRAPCSTTIPQRMVINCSTGPTIAYTTNTLGATIGTTTVSSSRDGQTVTRTYP